jgi:hypothetical protein
VEIVDQEHQDWFAELPTSFGTLTTIRFSPGSMHDDVRF